jgi:TonB family protein
MALIQPNGKWIFVVVLLCASMVQATSQTQTDAAGSRAIISKMAPAYPNLARSMALQGIVKIEAVVAPDGSVKAVSVRGGHPVLAQAAANAVRQWKWEHSARETHEQVELKFDREQ